jgi:hypothetical protein
LVHVAVVKLAHVNAPEDQAAYPVPQVLAAVQVIPEGAGLFAIALAAFVFPTQLLPDAVDEAVTNTEYMLLVALSCVVHPKITPAGIVSVVLFSDPLPLPAEDGVAIGAT